MVIASVTRICPATTGPSGHPLTASQRSVSVPALVLGSPAEIDLTWTVENHGTGEGPAAEWTDRVIVSQNADFGDGDDISVGEFSHSGAIGVGASYSRDQQVTLPAGLSGIAICRRLLLKAKRPSGSG